MNLLRLRSRLKRHKAGMFLLLAASRIYSFFVKFNESLWNMKILRQCSFNTRIICFGNITTGGTGKTSVVYMAAKELWRLGVKTIIIMRGYKRKNRKRKVVILDKSLSFLEEEAGDEALMLHKMLGKTDVPIIVSAGRCLAVKEGLRKFSPRIILMDDGFQNFSIKKDFSFLLINSRMDLMSESLLPLGNLREGTEAIKRANGIILTHCESAPLQGIEELKISLKSKFPGIKILESMHIPKYLYNPISKENVSFHEISECVCLSAIGDPEAFEENVKSTGIKIYQSWKFPDHHYFTEEEFKTIEMARNQRPIITTFKDYVRFPKNWEKFLRKDVYILIIEINFLCNDYKTFMDLLTENNDTTFDTNGIFVR